MRLNIIPILLVGFLILNFSTQVSALHFYTSYSDYGPTIDGTISLSEWDSSSFYTYNKTIDGAESEIIVGITYTSSDIYVLLQFTALYRSDDPYLAATYNFDNDGSGSYNLNEDIKVISCSGELYRDMYITSESPTTYTEDSVVNGVGEWSTSDTSGYIQWIFELRIPLDSGDTQDGNGIINGTTGISITVFEWSGSSGSSLFTIPYVTDYIELKTSSNISWFSMGDGSIAINQDNDWNHHSTREPFLATQMVDSNIGYALIEGKIGKTTNEGKSWLWNELELIPEPSYLTPKYSLALYNSTYGFAFLSYKGSVNEESYIFKTINGNDWTFVTHTDWAVNSAHCLNSTYILAPDLISNVLHTSKDGGGSWNTDTSLPPTNNINFWNSSHGWASGQGWLSITNDSGLSWSLPVLNNNSYAILYTASRTLGHLVVAATPIDYFKSPLQMFWETLDFGKTWNNYSFYEPVLPEGTITGLGITETDQLTISLSTGGYSKYYRKTTLYQVSNLSSTTWIEKLTTRTDFLLILLEEEPIISEYTTILPIMLLISIIPVFYKINLTDRKVRGKRNN